MTTPVTLGLAGAHPGLTPLLGAPAVAPADATLSEAAQQRVERLRARFLWTWTHPMWERWRREAEEDYAFYTGTGQWPEDVRQRLQEQKRSILTINEIRPVVQVLTGYERGARLEIRPIPEGHEDLDDVTVLARLMKRTMDDQDGDYKLSDGFEDGVVTGLGVYFVGLDYEDDVIHGRPTVEKSPLGETIWDPDAREYDLSDAQEVFRHRMVARDKLAAQFPEHADAIARAVETLRTADGAQGQTGHVIPANDGADPYRRTDTLSALSLYDDRVDEVRVLECWYRTYETVWLLADKRNSRVDELPDDAAVLQAARDVAKVDDQVRLVKRQRRRIEMSLILPALGLELEHGNPFDNDTEAYPIVPFWAYREGREILGVVRNLKDPQREINKRRSAMADAVARHGSIKWKTIDGALLNPEVLENGFATSNVLKFRNPQAAEATKEVAPPDMPAWIYQMQQVAKMEIREISGINADLLGQRDQTASGIAIARRQQQGQVIATSLFDRYKRSRKLVGKRLAKRIQQVYTDEMTIRLDTGAAETDFVTLNQKAVNRDGTVTVARNIPDLKYDVIIADTPATPSARIQSLQMLLEILQRVPQYAPALAEEIIELSDIPNREKVLAKIRALEQQAAMAAGQPAPPTAPAGPSQGNGTGTPAGYTGPPLPPGQGLESGLPAPVDLAGLLQARNGG